jgi:hypothetical protein
MYYVCCTRLSRDLPRFRVVWAVSLVVLRDGGDEEMTVAWCLLGRASVIMGVRGGTLGCMQMFRQLCKL